MFALLLSLTLTDDPTKDVTKIEGTWIVESAIIGGEVKDKLKGERFIFKGNALTHKMKKNEEKGTYKTDTSKQPKTIDVTMDGDKNPTKGIWKIEGDMLTICGVPVGDFPRPKEFTSKADSEQVLIVLKREKP